MDYMTDTDYADANAVMADYVNALLSDYTNANAGMADYDYVATGDSKDKNGALVSVKDYSTSNDKSGHKQETCNCKCWSNVKINRVMNKY